MKPLLKTWVVPVLLSGFGYLVLSGSACGAADQFDEEMAIAGEDYRRGNYADCERNLERLTISAKASGTPSVRYGDCLNNLAEVYVAEGRLREAEHLFKEALDMRIKILGLMSNDTGRSLAGLARVAQLEGRNADAMQLLRRALKIVVHADGSVIQGNDIINQEYLVNNLLKNPDDIPGSPEVAIVLDGLASLYVSQGQYDVAQRLLKKVIAICDVPASMDVSRLFRKPWDGGVDLGGSLINLARIYEARGQEGDGLPLYERALSARKKAFGPGHPKTRETIRQLARLYRQKGRQSEAEDIEAEDRAAGSP